MSDRKFGPYGWHQRSKHCPQADHTWDALRCKCGEPATWHHYAYPVTTRWARCNTCIIAEALQVDDNDG